MIVPIPSKKGTYEIGASPKKLTMRALHSLENRARVLFAQTHNAQIVCIIWRQKTLTRIDTPPKALLNRHVYSHFRNKVPWRKKEDDVFHRRPFYARRRSLACVIGVHLPMSGVLGVVIMLQVTGHAGGVPKATLERGRSVEFPSEGNTADESVLKWPIWYSVWIYLLISLQAIGY